MNIWGIRKYGYNFLYIIVVVLYATMNGNKEENILRNDTSEAA